jgi:adenosylcobinamide-phosphate synthase
LLAVTADSSILAGATVLLAGVIDVAFGEPPNAVHPVVWIGRLVTALERRGPRGRPRAELAYGALIVAVTTGVCAAAGFAIVIVLVHLPWWLALPLGAVALKVTFSLRGLVAAGRHVQRALDTDTEAAREGLRALVSRHPDLEPPQIVSAAIESLAENLTDSVVAPLLFFALLGLPGALAYRAINTMDAMIGYHGEYEYLGKVAARADDVANFIPARLTGLLLTALAATRGSGAAAWAALRRQRRLSTSPNKLWTIAPMAGALGVRLEKPGMYAVGPGTRPLRAAIIGEAAVLVWAAGAIALVATAALAALLAGWWW